MEERFLRAGRAIEPEQRRPGVPLFLTMMLAGLGRFLALVAVAAAISMGIGLLVGVWRDSDLLRAATIGLYVGGAALVAVGALSWGGQSYDVGGYEVREVAADPDERRLRQSRMGVYVVVGVAQVALAALLESQIA